MIASLGTSVDTAHHKVMRFQKLASFTKILRLAMKETKRVIVTLLTINGIVMTAT